MGRADLLAMKHLFLGRLRALAEGGASRVADTLAKLYAPAAVWHGSHPLNDAAGHHAIATTAWLPLFAACPDLERRDEIFAAGDYRGSTLIAAMGHYCGTFRGDLLSIPATGRPVFLRFGEVHRIADGRIVESWCLWDLLDLMRQAGVWPIAPSLGVEGLWPGPISGDGLVLYDTVAEEGNSNLAQTLAMHKTLGDYDDRSGQGRQGLLEMPQKQHWHPKMMWYGPAGIGTTRGLDGFVDDHQLPFRLAFPNRKGGAQIVEPGKGGHYIRIGDGKYSVTGGWPSVRGLHLGGGFLAMPPTGREITMRVMDFYLHHEGFIRENWVPIDIIDVLQQMGVDVFARMRNLVRGGPAPAIHPNKPTPP